MCWNPKVAAPRTGLALLLCVAGLAAAQETEPVKTQPITAPAPTSQPTSMPSVLPSVPTYGGDLWKREYLTGDWWGARQTLADNGVLFNFDVTQVFQHNAHGGKSTHNGVRYSGSADYWLKLDTARMKLWPGGLIVLHGETQFGQGIQGKTGSVISPNFDAMLPTPGRDGGLTTLSEFYMIQALSEKFAIVAGKVDALGLTDMNAFANNERTQFMNFGLRVNPQLAHFAPYTTMMAAAVFMPTDWFKITTGVADNDLDGNATRTGFNTAFHGRNWLTTLQEVEFKVKPFGLLGHQRAGWAWTSKDAVALGGSDRVVLPSPWPAPLLTGARALGLAAGVLEPARRPDDWMVYYNFDQFVYNEADDPNQGIGVFGRVGYSTGESNPIEQFYSLGAFSQGLVPTRDRDTCGLGYYHANLSDEIRPFLDVHSEQGIELFYNIEITPWLHITPDLQVILNPGGGFQDRDTAIVYGVRMQMSF